MKKHISALEHVDNAIWSATVREKLQCAREVQNAKDGYAISVLQVSVVVGHLPQKISTIISYKWQLEYHITYNHITNITQI